MNKIRYNRPETAMESATGDDLAEYESNTQ